MRISKKDLASVMSVVVDMNVVQVSKERMRKIQDEQGLEDIPVVDGLYVYSKNTSYLRKDLDHALHTRAYWHEVAHAFSHKVVEGDYFKGEWNEKKVEKVAQAIQNYLYGIKVN